MTPEQFIARWKGNPLTERAGAQGHFDDLCELLGVDKPRDPDHYCFERGAGKAGGGEGWADVWKRGCFGWENKRPDRIAAKPGHEAELKKRTLTNLYNQRPAWLDNAHKALDAAVAAAYGWRDYTPDLPDEEILRRLLALNLERKAAETPR